MASTSGTAAQDLRARVEEELVQFVKEKRDELLKLRFQHHTGRLESTARLKQVRKEVARALTVLAEKKGETA